MKRDTNTHYEWPSGSAVTQVDVRTQKNGQSVAYLYADPAAPKDTLLEIRSALRLKGWGTLSDNRDGKFGLRVSGMKDGGSSLIGLLEHSGYSGGTPQIRTDKPEKEAPKGFINTVKDHSLRASGLFYTLGNAVYLASGILRSKENLKRENKTGKIDSGQIQSALTWGAGDLLVLAIGGKNDSRQLTSLLTKLKQHYVKEGIDLPVTAAIHAETADASNTVGKKISNFAHEYLNQIKCLTESVAAIGYYKAGKDQGNTAKQITAVTFGLGFLASALIPEKKIDEEKYEKAGKLGRWWMRIQANPLSVGGLSGYSNTILTTYSAHKEGQRRKLYEKDPKTFPYTFDKNNKPIIPSKHYKLDYAAPGVMFFGNGLYAASKKTVGGDIKTTDMVSDVYRIASQIINKLPEGERERALESTAKFLGERPEVSDTRAQVREKLVTQMTIQRQNPWFENITLPARTKSASPAPSLVQAPQAAPKPTIDATNATHIAKGVAENPQLEHATAR